MSTQDHRPDRDQTLFSVSGVDLPSFAPPLIQDPRDWRNVRRAAAPHLSHDAQAVDAIAAGMEQPTASYLIGGCVDLNGSSARPEGIYRSPPPNGLPDLSGLDIAIARPALPGDLRPTPPQPGASPFMPRPVVLPEKPMPAKIVIAVYLDDGRVFEYDVNTTSQAREHTAAIITGGYRSCQMDTSIGSSEEGVLEHYPPHRILKVKATGPGIRTNYPDRIRGT
ncbi:hypothetical protein BAJUN_02030 [Bajunvirus bajun]|uniref:Uncharacterized protein n=1 Tax=Brevundimonas phage vB_BgoS-Bajun TaxID=2948594 RepID=A0A9E7N6V5_9CAUD|nr:hypothetical protein BAJUN_02030 [Brevundimonas phage vB_BgoS-Bajun]